MFDTIILNISQNSYQILQPERFKPSANLLRGYGANGLKCVNNTTPAEEKIGIKRPRLTITKRATNKGIEIPLKIEFSAPKLLFGTNVDELEESDFKRVVIKLQSDLNAMGVATSEEAIMNAKVSALHPSKNIELKDGYTSSFVIKELHKINLKKKLDLAKVTFRNDGQSLQMYAKRHQLVIYDKIADLSQANGRSIDGDQPARQLSLFEAIQKIGKPMEILRIEVRLAHKTKLGEVLKEIGYKESPSFQEIFKKDICQKIVKLYWEKMIAEENLFIFDLKGSPKKHLEELLKANKKIKPKEAIYLVGLKALCKEEGGTRELRHLLKPICVDRTWYRIRDDTKKLNKKVKQKQCHSWVAQVEEAIKIFASYKTEKLSTSPVNKSKV